MSTDTTGRPAPARVGMGVIGVDSVGVEASAAGEARARAGRLP
jgi:hypothetical protein